MTTIAERRAQAQLDKVFNFSGRNMTLREFLFDLSGNPQASIDYYHGWGKKRNGIRQPTKPKWACFCNGMEFMEIGLTGARFLNSLLATPVDLDAMQAKGDAQYASDLRMCQ